MLEPKIETFIRCCSIHKNTNEIKKLLTAGININAFGPHGRTALMEVCRLNTDIAIVHFLIKNGADIQKRTQDGETAMILLGRSQKSCTAVEEVLLELLHNGANIDECDNRGCTALHNATLNHSNPEIIKIFIKHGANLQKNNKEMISPAEQIFYNTKDTTIIKQCLKILPDVKKLFFPFIANRQMADFNGNWNKNNVEECIKIFLHKGIDINYQNELGMTALMIFCKNNSHNLPKKSEKSFLEKMLRQPNQQSVAEIIKILIKNGANTKLKNLHNKTAMDLCANKKELLAIFTHKQ